MHTGCTCASPKFEGAKADGSNVCATVAITDCKHYESISACDVCHTGFDKAVGGATCDCASPKAKSVDNNGLPICANSAIANCNSYASVSTCHACASGYDKASSGASCTK